MADVAPKEPAGRRKPRPKGRWLPVVVGAVAAGILAAVAWFGLHFFRDSAYEDERAFRILGHIVGQFANFQGAVAGALQLVPTGTYLPQDETTRQKEINKYQDTLALRHVTLTTGSCEAPRDGSPSRFRISQERGFSMCRLVCRDPKSTASCERTRIPLTLSGPLAEQLPAFIFQDFFDSVVIATREGETLASVPRGQDRGHQVQLHDVAAVDPLGGNAAELLRRAAQRILASNGGASKAADDSADTDGDATEARTGGRPGYAMVFNDRIAGQSVRVFVLPFVPAHPTQFDERDSHQLYLIALKQQRLLGALNEALGSGGALVVTLSVLFGILAWPLLSLRFESPQEAIAPIHVFAILMSLLLLPAVIVTAGFSLWTRSNLMAWADTHAEFYAKRVEQVLVRELDAGIHVLEELRAQFLPYAPFTREAVREVLKKRDFDQASIDANLPDEGNASVPLKNVVCVAPRQSCLDPLRWSPWEEGADDWSSVRSAAPLNAQGRSTGLTLSYFDPALITQLDVGDREYFRALMQHEEWRTDRLWGDTEAAARGHEHRYVAQRLFNRTDAARVLQLAIPIDGINGKRLGVTTGDTRVYGLTQALRPPLLRYAVFDSRSGAVLFHSRERLSLAENLLVETEHNASLAAAMQRRASTWSRHRVLAEDHFAGRYLAASHRFLYRSVAGAPWGIVVFYPTDGINEMVLQTAVATLASVFALIIALTLVSALVILALPERADQVVLRWIWPKWQSRDAYRRIAWWITVAQLSIAVVIVAWLSRFEWKEIAGLLAAVAAAAWVAARFGRRRAPDERPPSVTSYRRGYVQCVFGVVVLVSALPTVLLALGYHDTSVRAVIRDELNDALGDEEQRRHTLNRDHQRFAHEALSAEDAATRSRRLPVPGYQPAVDHDGRMIWKVKDVEPTPWLAKCGPPTLDPVRRVIWSFSTARQVQRPITLSPVQEQSQEGKEEPGKEPASSPARDATTRVQADEGECPDPVAVRTWRRSEDGISARAGFPLEALDGDLAVPSSCEPGAAQEGADLCRDDALVQLYVARKVARPFVVSVICVLLITLMSAQAARRLFGIRMPFASRFTPSGDDERNSAQLLDAELRLLKRKESQTMTSKDEADWRAVKCRHIYQRMWDALKTDEQFLVYQLACGQYANPENQAVIERLLRRGYLTLAPWPRIVEPGFAEFVRTVAHDESFDQLKYDATHTLWSQLRAPLLVLVVIVAVLLMWLAGSTMHLIAAALAGVAGLFGSIQRVTSFLHRDKPPAEGS